jgi:hypothetical protein
MGALVAGAAHAGEPIEPTPEEVAAPAPANLAPGAAAEEAAFGPMEDEEEMAWGPKESVGKRGRLGVRGGVYVPASDFDAGPAASFFYQMPLGPVTLEVGVGFAQITSSDQTSSSFLWIGNAGAQWKFYEGETKDMYLIGGVGMVSEDAANGTDNESSFLGSIDIGVGLVTGRCLDVRANFSLFTNSDNVGSASSVMVGVIY